ncbi:MAG TPA: hypothetical protein VFS21_16345 [Roseiflexaceae bacterium]|nr:hypothetical protein [Roseiflexaceae bacterium]
MMQRWLVVALALYAALAGGLRAAAPPPVYLPIVLGPSNLVPSTNLLVSTATFLGGSGADAGAAVDVAPDGAVVLGGSFPSFTFPGVLTPTVVAGATSGAVLRLERGGGAILSATRIGAEVRDLEVSAAGLIAVCGDFGVATLPASGGTPLWSEGARPVARCAIGPDGTVAALAGTTVSVYSAAGQQRGSWSLGVSAASDIALDPASGTVVVTGYKQDDGGNCAQLQITFLRGYSPSGQLAWASYDWDKSQVGAANVCADTRGERVAIGRDGKLYFAGTINGGTGASIFARDPQDLGTRLDGGRNVVSDAYNNATNTGSVKMTWFGRYSPTTGALEQGSSLLTRLSSGRGNSIAPTGITADEQGRVYLAGGTACCLPNRDRLTVGGVAVGAYASDEAYLVMLTPDLRTRLHWTPLAGPSPASAGGSPATGIAVRNGVAAVSLTFSPSAGRGLITVRPLQPAPGGGTDAYLAVWPAR